MRQIASRIFLIILLLVLGCRKETDSIIEPSPQPKEIIPLVVGNKWVRAISVFDTTGAITSSRQDSIEVLRDTSANGSKWFILKMSGAEYLVANRPDGFWGLGGAGQYLWYKYPATVGDSFFVFGNTSDLRVKSIDTSIVVQNGRYSCYQYEFDIPGWVGAIGGSHHVEYFSPDMGFIKNENYSSSFISKKQYLVSVLELSSVTLK